MRPVYSAKPIATIASLAAALGVDELALKCLANDVAEHYYDFEIDKKTGGRRKITAPSWQLKAVQRRVNRAVFGNIKYPDYLFGGLAERDYFRNAEVHARARMVITLDVENFYPSIKKTAVQGIFQHFCKFSPEVSSLLAELTTLHGSVPQGACTSSHIANLLFYAIEGPLVHELRQKGIRYSRLLDDITLSATVPLSKMKVTAAINKVASMAKFAGCRLKSSKTRVSSAQNPLELMTVTGLWMNRGHPRVLPLDRSLIRAEVKRCMDFAGVSRTAEDYHALHDRVSGRVAKLAYVGHAEATEYRRALSSNLPLFNSLDEVRTQHLLRELLRVNSAGRASPAYADRYYQLMHRLNIHARNNQAFADEKRAALAKRAPLLTREERIYGRG